MAYSWIGWQIHKESGVIVYSSVRGPGLDNLRSPSSVGEQSSDSKYLDEEGKYGHLCTHCSQQCALPPNPDTEVLDMAVSCH